MKTKFWFQRFIIFTGIKVIKNKIENGKIETLYRNYNIQHEENYIVVMLSFLKIFPFHIHFKFKKFLRFKQIGEVFLFINKFVLYLVNFKTK